MCSGKGTPGKSTASNGKIGMRSGLITWKHYDTRRARRGRSETKGLIEFVQRGFHFVTGVRVAGLGGYLDAVRKDLAGFVAPGEFCQ